MQDWVKVPVDTLLKLLSLAKLKKTNCSRLFKHLRISLRSNGKSQIPTFVTSWKALSVAVEGQHAAALPGNFYSTEKFKARVKNEQAALQI